MQGLYGRTHFELEDFIDMKSFDNLQIDIWKGIAAAKPKTRQGYLPPFLIYKEDEMSYTMTFKPLMKAYQEYKDLPVTDPVKMAGEEINNKHGYNALATYIKYAFGAHDLYCHYPFWDHYEGWRSNINHRRLTDIAEYFPSLIQWIDNLVIDGVFANIGRAYLVTLDSNGYSFEHRDPPLDPDVSKDIVPEFIHIRPSLDRPFYVYDPDTKEKHYINSRVGWWNDRDVHGGDVTLVPSYALRIDGIFTDKFRNTIQNV